MFRHRLFDRPQDRVAEADEDDLVGFESGIGDRFLQRRDDAGIAAFDFDVAELSFRHRRQKFGEQRQFFAAESAALPGAGVEFAQFCQRRPGDREVAIGGPAGGFVVTNQEGAVGGEHDIAFESVGILLPGEPGGGDGVFRRFPGGAPVGDDQRFRGTEDAAQQETAQHGQSDCMHSFLRKGWNIVFFYNIAQSRFYNPGAVTIL